MHPRSRFTVASLFTLFALIAQGCSSEAHSSDATAEGELRGAPARCGGAADVACHSGKVCHKTSDDPDAEGVCESPQPGEKGGACHGDEFIECHEGLECKITEPGHVSHGINRLQPIFVHEPKGVCVSR